MPSMNGAAVIQLPNGFWEGDSRHVQAVLRPLNGHDEEFLLEEAASYSPVRRATAILSRCTLRLGPVSPVSETHLARLSAGDREALLLHLRRLTFGDRIQATVSCPRADCGQRLDLEVLVSDLLMPVSREADESYETEVTSGNDIYRMRFRLPTGADQEAAVEAAGRGIQAGVRTLVERCVAQVSASEDAQGPARAVAVQDLPEPVVAGLSETMARLDPQAEVELAVRCPACDTRFQTLLDAAAFLFEEVGQRLRHLYSEVHTLALHYHWSEAEILGMTARKRQRYLGLLRESLREEETG
jgi:hypothetical protein